VDHPYVSEAPGPSEQRNHELLKLSFTHLLQRFLKILECHEISRYRALNAP
jgi:hypothetical protein